MSIALINPIFFFSVSCEDARLAAALALKQKPCQVVSSRQAQPSLRACPSNHGVSPIGGDVRGLGYA